VLADLFRDERLDVDELVQVIDAVGAQVVSLA
jgi:hypothetical protein